MRAFKFFARGALGPFTRARWPAPSGGSPGAWVEAAGRLPGLGVHACRAEDLAYWLHDELWEVELGGEVVAAPTQVEARRGRLLGRVEAWSPAAAQGFASACALRAQALAASALEAAGQAGAAAAVRTAGLETLEALPLAAEVAASPRAAGLAGYLADLAGHIRTRRPAGATYIGAVVTAVALERPEAFAEERRSQGLLLGARLGLPGAGSAL